MLVLSDLSKHIKIVTQNHKENTMDIQITARKFKAKDSLKGFIDKKVKSLEKFHPSILDADVVLSYTHQADSIKHVDIVLQVPGKTVSASEESSDFNISVDTAVEKLQRQLQKLKTKQISKKR